MTYSFADWREGKPVPKGWDSADACADGWSREDLDGFMRSTVKLWSPSSGEKPAEKIEERREPSPAPTPPPNVETRAGEPDRPRVAVDMRRREEIPSKKNDDYPDDVPTGSALKLRDHPLRDKILTLREWVFLSGDCVFYHRDTGETMSKTAFDLAMAPMTPMVEIEKDDGTVTQKKYPSSRTLIEWLGGEIVYQTMFRPDIDLRFFEVDGIRYVNSYLPSTTPEADPNWEDHWAWEACEEHIKTLLPETGELLIQWMAHNVQRPGHKIRWTPVIVGVEGDGKTSIANMLRAAMGVRNVQDVSQEALFSNFNSWAEGSCVRVLEEIRVHGNSRSTVMDKLKPLITNEVVDIVRKGLDGKQVKNTQNYLALTNHMDALAISEGDRRWAVMKTPFRSKDEKDRVLPKDYFDRLYEAILNHNGVLRGWLLNVDISQFDPNTAPPMTSAKRLMIEAAMSPLRADVQEALDLGGDGIGREVVATDCLNNRIKDMGGRTVNTSALANILRECGWVKYDKTVKWNGSARRVYYRPEAIPEGMDEASLTTRLRMMLDDTMRDAPVNNEPEELPW